MSIKKKVITNTIKGSEYRAASFKSDWRLFYFKVGCSK